MAQLVEQRSRKAQVTGSNPVVGSTNARGFRKGPSFRVWGDRAAERFAFEVCDAPFGRCLSGAELSLRATSSCCKPDLLAGHISQQPQFVASRASSTPNRKRRRCATVFAERLQAQKYVSASRAKKGGSSVELRPESAEMGGSSFIARPPPFFASSYFAPSFPHMKAFAACSGVSSSGVSVSGFSPVRFAWRSSARSSSQSAICGFFASSGPCRYVPSTFL